MTVVVVILMNRPHEATKSTMYNKHLNMNKPAQMQTTADLHSLKRFKLRSKIQMKNEFCLIVIEFRMCTFFHKTTKRSILLQSMHSVTSFHVRSIYSVFFFSDLFLHFIQLSRTCKWKFTRNFNATHRPLPSTLLEK